MDSEATNAVYRTIVESAPDIIVQLDPDGRIEFINRPISGRAVGEMIGGSIFELTRRAEHKDLRAAFARALADDATVTHEGKVRLEDGTPRRYQARIRRISTPAGWRLIAYVTDVTAHHDTERALAHVERELRHAQKMEAIGTLAGGVAHDFNNILSVIFSYADTLKADLAEHPNVHADIDEITRAATRGATLSRQLLAFGRRQELAPVQTDLGTILKGVHKMLRRLLREDVELEIEAEAEADPDPIYVDVGQIEQVLMNLIVNARDAIRGGGKITITTGRRELDREAADRYQVDAGTYSSLTVADTGHGMDPETLARIFEPFYTTKDEGEGTGLGLSTVFGIVKQSGGAIAVESVPGDGTQFTVLLPVVDAAPRTVPRTDSNVPRAMAHDQHATLLVVEDDQTVRYAMRRILTQAGYTVMTASDGEEGLEVAREYDGPIHLVVTDIVMPGLSGPELARQIRALRPQTGVVFMTGYGDGARERNVAEQMQVPVLGKPFSGPELLELVRTTIAAA